MTNHPRITGVARAMPPRRIEQWMVRYWSEQRFQDKMDLNDSLLQIFDNAGIKRRHFCMPPAWYLEPHDFEEKNNAYIEQSLALSQQAVQEVLYQADLKVDDIDYLLFVSTTGLATPSIDARLIGSMGFDPHTRRSPVWGLGCAGGAAGLSQAHHYLLGHPRHRVLVVTVELCSLTFHFEDFTKSNFVATALFADGCAAAVLSGAETGDDRGPSILDTRSTLWPDSLDVMGWNFHNEGMQVVFSRAIPAIVMRKAKQNIDEFLKHHDMDIGDLNHFIAHPGGTKVLEAYERSLGIDPAMNDLARHVMQDCGNVSSVTVMLVLEEFIKRQACRTGDRGLLTALGPGFSSEHLLLQW